MTLKVKLPKWILSMDIASNLQGNGAGMVLEGILIE